MSFCNFITFTFLFYSCSSNKYIEKSLLEKNKQKKVILKSHTAEIDSILKDNFLKYLKGQ